MSVRFATRLIVTIFYSPGEILQIITESCMEEFSMNYFNLIHILHCFLES